MLLLYVASPRHVTIVVFQMQISKLVHSMKTKQTALLQVLHIILKRHAIKMLVTKQHTYMFGYKPFKFLYDQKC